MAVRREEDPVGRGEEDAAFRIQRGQHPLSEEEHIGGFEAEVPVRLEVRARRRVVRLGGHHVPRDRGPRARARGLELASEEIEKAAPAHRSHRERPLGSFEPEARGLSAGDEEPRDVSGAELLGAPTQGLPPAQLERGLRLPREDLRGRELARTRRRRSTEDGSTLFLENRQIQGG